MPYVLSPIIKESAKGLWGEGSAYSKKNLYSMDNPEHPPVNYDEHSFRPHSLPHVETAAHTQKNGKTIEHYFQQSHLHHFFGKVSVVKLKGEKWQQVDGQSGVFHWEASLEDLKQGLVEAQGHSETPNKLILSAENVPSSSEHSHDPNYVLTMSIEAAQYLVSHSGFDMYGTSWKSTDFKPGKRIRPVHDKIFEKAVILECLDMSAVKAGVYMFFGFPIPIEGASESLVCPVLFEKGEISIT